MVLGCIVVLLGVVRFVVGKLVEVVDVSLPGEVAASSLLVVM